MHDKSSSSELGSQRSGFSGPLILVTLAVCIIGFFFSPSSWPSPASRRLKHHLGTWSTIDGLPLASDSDVVWLGHLPGLGNKDIPQTISVSYGPGEKIFLSEYAVPVCELFAKLGARGVSILFASGDHGVGAGTAKTIKEEFSSSLLSQHPVCVTSYLSLQAAHIRRPKSLTTFLKIPG